MKEIWKDIKNYEGMYQISNLGRVKSFKNKNPKIMKHTFWQGYPVVQLSNKNVRHTFEIHRLVAETFIPNPNGYPFVNHINEDRTDFSINNLEWCTQKMNVNHSKRKMYHPVNFMDFNTDKFIYKKKSTSKHKDKIYTYFFYRVNIPRIKVDKIFSNYEKAIKFRNECLLLIDEFYNQMQEKYSIK